jgi:protein-disulfide isomerase
MHKNAKRDALAALCGAEQGKYMDYKKAIYDMEDRKAGASVSDNDRVDAATKAGLDGTKVAACLASDRYMGQVESDMAKGEGMRVDSTPTVFLDGKKLDMGAFRDLTTLTAFLDRVVAE